MPALQIRAEGALVHLGRLGELCLCPSWLGFQPFFDGRSENIGGLGGHGWYLYQ